MFFDINQIRFLNRKARKENIKTKTVEFGEQSYLEGWYIIQQANRIFGHDGWERKTSFSECVSQRQKGAKYAASYICKVQIVVHAGSRTIIREGMGGGEAYGTTPGTAHECAVKIAETNAMKRAFVTFGNAFGLSLYQKNID